METTIEQVIEKAKELHEGVKKWHFHMLTPDCIYNENKDKYAFVLENVSDTQIFVAYSDTHYMEQGKLLVELLHSIKVDEGGTHAHIESNLLREILRRAKELNDKGISWHHHMFFPKCMYNKHRGMKTKETYWTGRA